MNLGVASELDIDAEQVRDVLAAVAPIVGTARVVSATSKIMRALELDLLEIEAETRKRRKPIWGSPRHHPARR